MQTPHAESELRFESLIERVETARQLPFDELRELARLYRVHSARLSQLRTHGMDREAIRYLNALCVRAYTHVYVTPRHKRPRTGPGLRGLPATLVSTWRMQLFATLLLATGAVIGGALARENPAALSALIPAQMYPPAALERLATSESARTEFLERRDTSATKKSMFGSLLFANNTRVGLLAFATGILAGIPTVLLVLYNGLTLGAFSSIFTSDANAVLFFAWIIPHGIPEISAIILCAAGGLLLGDAVLSPGREGRVVRLRAAGIQALHLVTASVPLFAVAAVVESFVRESTLSTETRFGVAAGTLLMMLAYLALIALLARRQERVDVSWLGGDDFKSTPPDESAGSD